MILENYIFSETNWNFKEQFEDTRVITSNIIFIILLDHQAAHIYTYMGQNIHQILGVFELKILFYATKAKFVGLGKECRLQRMDEI